MSPTHSHAARAALLALITAFAALAAGCATYDERVAPLPVPGEHEGTVKVAGASVIARGFVDVGAASQAFGFDIRRAGLLPVQFVVDNQSGEPVRVEASQTLLLDREGNAWPLLTADAATTRVRETVRSGESIEAGARGSFLTALAGAVAGAAVGVITGEGVGEAAGKGAVIGGTAGALSGGYQRYRELDSEIYHDLMDKSIAQRELRPGELAYGFLFFPGKNEAESVQSLRLRLRVGDEVHIADVPVAAVSPR